MFLESLIGGKKMLIFLQEPLNLKSGIDKTETTEKRFQ